MYKRQIQIRTGLQKNWNNVPNEQKSILQPSKKYDTIILDQKIGACILDEYRV